MSPGPFDDDGWGVAITYAQDGYVEDDELLAEMKQDTESQDSR